MSEWTDADVETFSGLVYDWLYPDATRREADDFTQQVIASGVVVPARVVEEAKRERAVWFAENSRAQAELASLRERVGECICNNTGPGTDGPDECCPQHGRSYSDWIDYGDTWSKRGNELAAELSRLRSAVEALADEWERSIRQGHEDNPDGHHALTIRERDYDELRALLLAEGRDRAREGAGS